MKVRFSSHQRRQLLESMSWQDVESFSYAAFNAVKTPDGWLAILKDVYPLKDSDYNIRHGAYAEPFKSVQDDYLRKAFRQNLHPMTIHTHPHPLSVKLSGQDMRNSREMYAACSHKHWVDLVFDPELTKFDGQHFSPESKKTRKVDSVEFLGSEIVLLGARRPVVSGEHHRQTLIPGFSQEKIHGVKLGIIGLGGNGAQEAMMLASIGFRDFVLVEDDCIEESNLSRIPYASRADIGKFKVDIAARYIRMKNPEARIEPMACKVEQAVEELKTCHVIIGCVDNDGARKTLNELSVACLIPYLDLGCEITLKDGELQQFGQVRAIIPGETPCLICTGSIDIQEVMESMMSPAEKASRRAVGYLRGTDESPAPAILQLNTGIASLATQALVCMVNGTAPPSFLHLDMSGMKIQAYDFKPSKRCPVCGPGGLFAEGEMYSENIMWGEIPSLEVGCGEAG